MNTSLKCRLSKTSCKIMKANMVSWYAWQDSNLRPFAPEASGSKSLNSLSLFLSYGSTLSGNLLALEVDPLSSQLDRVLVQFRYSRAPQPISVPASPVVLQPYSASHQKRMPCLQCSKRNRKVLVFALPPLPRFHQSCQRSGSQPDAQS